MEDDLMRRMSPYVMASPPTSPGRALLARAYAHYCMLLWGHTGEDIDEALASRGDPRAVQEVAWSTRLFGELMASGDIRSWARPFGGGEPTLLKATVWELDDFRNRFANSAINVAQPFDAKAAPTHWIFVDLADWNRAVDASLSVEAQSNEAAVPPQGAKLNEGKPSGTSPNAAMPCPDEADASAFIRLPEVLRRTALSKATIYRRMDTGRFPRNIPLSGGVAVWREQEVADWIADPV